MDKVFILSLHRTATRSATGLMLALGYKALHWPFVVDGEKVEPRIAGREHDLDHVWSVVAPIVEQRDAFADTPWPVLYRQALAACPDARFVLMHRSPRAWVRSVRRHTTGRPLDPIERVQYWAYLDDRPESLDKVSDNRLFEMHWRHMAEVTSFFNEAAPDRLAVIGVDEPAPGERLQLFLGYPPLVPLPHVAESAGRKIDQGLRAALREAMESLEVAEHAVSQGTRGPMFHRHLANLLEKAGRDEEAKAARQKADEYRALLRERQARHKAARVAQRRRDDDEATEIEALATE